MLKNFVKNSFWIAITFFCAMHMSPAQDNGPTVQNPFPAGSALLNIGPNAEGNLTIGGEYKQPKNVIEPQKPVFWTWTADIGYTSEYNFRGTDLMPNSDGGGFISAEVSKWNFTLGIYGIHQFGTARATSWSMGESGGGGTGAAKFVPKNQLTPPPGQFIITPTFLPETTQNRFNELDVYLQYHLALGPVDLTVGNIAFFIERDAQTLVKEFLSFQLSGTDLIFGPFKFFHFTEPSVGNEQFDRIFVRLSTSKIPYITPSITYYQTIYNEGQGAEAVFIPGPQERYDNLGGYLDGRLRGNFPVTQWLTINPYGVISVSFRDRVEPITNPATFKDAVRGRSLNGFNVAQAGLEVPIHLLHTVGNSTSPYAPPDVDLYLVPFGWYSYHIADPPPGTLRNELWGGAKFTLTF